MQIRPLTAQDTVTSAVEPLWRACGLTRPWNDPGADLALALRGGGESSTVLGAVDEGTLVGTVMVGHDGHRGWIYYLAVSPDRRGSGIGQALVAAAEAWVRERGIPKVMLMIRAENSGAGDFYTRLGYADQQVSVYGRFLDPELQAMREGEEPQTATAGDGHRPGDAR